MDVSLDEMAHNQKYDIWYMGLSETGVLRQAMKSRKWWSTSQWGGMQFSDKALLRGPKTAWLHDNPSISMANDPN